MPSCYSLVVYALAWADVAVSITSEMQAVLAKHNVYRCMHAVPVLTWDDAIAANAQAWATNGVYEHSSSASRVVNGEQLGENLAWGSPSRTGTDSTVAWYSEIKFTSPYGTASSPDDTTVAGEAIGHYTAVVWKDSTKVGCGKGKATVNGNEGDYWVCQYGPTGNWLGQFTAQVLAPTVSVTSCGGTSADAPSSWSSGSSGGSSTVTVTTTLPSGCTPSPLLPVGGLCVYGYQCASKFCCPRMKLCLADSSSGAGTSDLNVDETKGLTKADVTAIVFASGGTCVNPWANSNSCLQTAAGQPLGTWNQAVCECKAEYMTRYNAGTWVTLNSGIACNTGTTAALVSSGSVMPVASTGMIALAALAAAINY